MARLLLCLVIFMLITDISKVQYKKIAAINDSVGLYPQDGLVNSGDTLFGTLQQGAKLNGYSQPGALYRVKTDGSAFKSLYNFRDTNGVYPCGGLYAWQADAIQMHDAEQAFRCHLMAKTKFLYLYFGFLHLQKKIV